MHAVEAVVPDSKIAKAYLFPGGANATFKSPTSPEEQEAIRAKIYEILSSRARIVSHWWNEEEAASKCIAPLLQSSGFPDL
jgi:hypothetical protein